MENKLTVGQIRVLTSASLRPLSAKYTAAKAALVKKGLLERSGDRIVITKAGAEALIQSAATES